VLYAPPPFTCLQASGVFIDLFLHGSVSIKVTCMAGSGVFEQVSQ
jgi:hypothetical protein